MKNTQLDRIEKKFDTFVEYVQGELQNSRAEFAAVRAEIASFRSNVREQFETVLDRLKRLEHSYTGLNFETVRLGKEIHQVRSDIEGMRVLLMKLETETLEGHVRVSQLRDDMQQRFKTVNERLSELERLLAA